jgi:hypothetical protein
MKKWLTLMVLAVAVAGTVGLSSRVSAQPERELSDAELEARVDARLQEIMHALLTARRSEAHPAALGR